MKIIHGLLCLSLIFLGTACGSVAQANDENSQRPAIRSFDIGKKQAVVTDQNKNLLAAEAQKIAVKYVPEGSVHYKTAIEDGVYQVSFYHETAGETYELNIDPKTKKVLSFESEWHDLQAKPSGSTSDKTLSEQSIKKIITDDLPGAEVLSLKLDRSDKYQKYEAQVKTKTVYGEITVHPQTGKIIERDFKVGAPPVASETKNLLSLDAIRKLALEKVPDGVITDLDLERKNGAYHYQVEVKKNGFEYDLYFDGQSGKLLESIYHEENDWPVANKVATTPTPAKKSITVDEAKNIALAKVPGAFVKECEQDYEHGKLIYEGELLKDGWSYEFEIDAETGKILKWEKEWDD